MLIKSAQISLFDTFNGVFDSIENKEPTLVSLLDEHIDFDVIIPSEFNHIFYTRIGRCRKYSLESFIRSLVLQKLLGLTQVKQLILILKCSKELREFCGFTKIPDAPQFSRFKREFCKYIALIFENLVSLTEPICQEINSKKAKYLIFDTTGIEPQVVENNPKFFNSKLKQAKKHAKDNENYNAYTGVYGLLPPTSNVNENIKQQYINGHFCYAYKAGILTNGLGIVRHISLFDNDFKSKHPEIVSKKTDNPDLDKEIGDSTALNPVLSDFFSLHSNFEYTTFLGDSAFDSYDNYTLLKDEFKFKRVCVPLNPRNSKPEKPSHFDENGIPLCPLDDTSFIYLGKSGGENRSLRHKWVCHKSIAKGNTRICECENPCTDSSYGRCIYTYPDANFRLYPGIIRGTEHWDNLYRHRILVERTINLFKNSFGISDLKTANETTIKTELYLAGITQLIGVILAKAMHQSKLYKSVRKLISKIA